MSEKANTVWTKTVPNHREGGQSMGPRGQVENTMWGLQGWPNGRPLPAGDPQRRQRSERTEGVCVPHPNQTGRRNHGAVPCLFY